MVAVNLRRVLRDLSGRSYRRTLDLLTSQLDATLKGLDLAADLAAGRVPPTAARAGMGEVEHEGDSRRAALVAELATALTTPIDREDLYRFSRSVDDILDNLRDLVRETDLFGMPGDPADLTTLEAVREGLIALRDAVAHLVDDPRLVQEGALAARKAAGRVRREYQEALAALFREGLRAETLPRRELLRRQDVIGLRLNTAAADLSDALLKRGH
ncbi:hypothetical protein GCM10010275_13950 [Streptomyces litmocidini]|uniref:DUF47 domain-containing protein n=1 Tax=Streptomyces litmocidini TaxID=67318 RepID=UPI00167DAA8A|nr:DUF47 family protein [Streptomyces litmocidini]GGU80418.1 hypothetical protein GCM10010275_13950 [Streptomyces litmocidini]